MGGSGFAGAVGVLGASIFWGSNFIVTKEYQMGDGMVFQFFLCLGILLVGFVTIGWAEKADKSEYYDEFPFRDFNVTFSLEGLLGGMVWCLGNLLTVSIVQRIGIGLGLSIWSGVAMLFSFVMSRVSIFGVEPDELSCVVCGYFGVFFGAASLVIFSLVDTSDKVECVDPEDDFVQFSEEGEVGGQDQQAPLVTSSEEDQIASSPSGAHFRHRVEGMVMACISGLLYGTQFIPLEVHKHQYPRDDSVGEVTYQVRFFFSQFAGIFLTSTISFFIYAIYKKTKMHFIPHEAMVPSIVSGIMWGIGCTCSMIATAELGLGIGFPLSANGAFLVNASWSIFYFKEVQNQRGIRLFGLAAISNILSCIFLGVARS